MPSMPASRTWSITSVTVPMRAPRSATMTTLPSGFSARARSTICRTSRNSICRLAIQISLFGRMPMRMVPFCRASACSAMGLMIVAPVSLVNDVVTMKKISMMKTMSSIGVMLISASSRCACRLPISIPLRAR